MSMSLNLVSDVSVILVMRQISVSLKLVMRQICYVTKIIDVAKLPRQ